MNLYAYNQVNNGMKLDTNIILTLNAQLSFDTQHFYLFIVKMVK